MVNVMTTIPLPWRSMKGERTPNITDTVNTLIPTDESSALLGY